MGYSLKDLDRFGAVAKRQIIKKAIGATATPKAPKAPKPTKYRAKKAPRVLPSGVTYTFASEAEAKRYDELLLRLNAGEIKDLKLQPEFTLQEGFTTLSGEHIRARKYKADFSYKEFVYDGDDVKLVLVVEDVKGVKTDLYSLKKDLVAGGHCVEVREIK